MGGSQEMTEDVDLLCSASLAGGLGLLRANVSLTGEFNGAPNGAETPQRRHSIRARDGWEAFGLRPWGTQNVAH